MPAGQTRREFIIPATQSALLYGFHLPLSVANEVSKAATFAPNAFIRIDAQGVVTLIIPQV